MIFQQLTCCLLFLLCCENYIAKARRSMKHTKVEIARQAVEEGRSLLVIVNKVDLLRGKENKKICESVIKAVPEEIQTVIRLSRLQSRHVRNKHIYDLQDIN
ncbi:hypothetical protein ACH5RR_001797 [Cinchona calisaya]|uniref:Uncharacterized protein n=1 Tax=Cinchona calisaya TaxID=153742 RepID=A0ABD3B529_9GENT